MWRKRSWAMQIQAIDIIIQREELTNTIGSFQTEFGVFNISVLRYKNGIIQDIKMWPSLFWDITLPEITHESRSAYALKLLPITKHPFCLKLPFYWWLCGIWNFNNIAVSNDYCAWLWNVIPLLSLINLTPKWYGLLHSVAGLSCARGVWN